jgi:hypothetical protein
MFWIAQVAVVSFVMIFILHNLYFFFKEMLTVPKMKDMVKRPQQRYDALFRELRMRNEASNHEPDSSNNANNHTNANSANSANNHNSNNNDEMKNELKRYLMELNGKHPLPSSNLMEMGSNFTEMGSTFTGSAYQ